MEFLPRERGEFEFACQMGMIRGKIVRLPVAVDGSKVTANFKDGVLTVTLPKTPAAKGVTIPIKAG